MIFIVLGFIFVGLLIGVLAGLFGFGGGLIVVPAVMTFITIYEPAFASDSMHIAIATSLFCMIFTSLTTSYAHHRAKNILWNIVLKLKGGLIFGVIFGAVIASYFSSEVLKALFVIFMLYTITKWVSKLLSNSRSSVAVEDLPVNKPSSKLLYIYGFITGTVSVLLGIGGSIIIVPFFKHRNYKLAQATAIATSITPVLALFGAVSYILLGSDSSSVPDYCLGFVYLPAAIGIIIGSMIGAIFGVKLSRSIPNNIQNTIYLFIMVVVLLVMIL